MYMGNSLNNIETYSDGKLNFMVGLCERINLPNVFNNYLEQPNGRPAEIPYGILAEMMLVNMCDDHHPLYILDEYFLYKDLEGIFHYPVKLSQINDDRFEGFLDSFYKAGPRKIFAELAANAFSIYGITVKNINYDTTSKVMWGQYEAIDGSQDIITIDFGHSKDKREDKKQIKMGIGTAEGIIVDAKVLSGNIDDKTYNNNNLDDVEKTLENLNISKKSFYYIADSALFTEENLKKAANKNIYLITRVPDNTLTVKTFIEEAVDNIESLPSVTLTNAKGDNVVYKICERTGEYRGIKLKYAVCYSHSLEDSKKKTIDKNVLKEQESVEKLIKPYLKRDFACIPDAQKEIDKLSKKDLKKLKYHDVSLNIVPKEKKRRGRPSNDAQSKPQEYIYHINTTISRNEQKIEKEFKSSCMFVLASTDISITAEEILKEYKTQSSVEKSFSSLSPHSLLMLFF